MKVLSSGSKKQNAAMVVVRRSADSLRPGTANRSSWITCGKRLPGGGYDIRTIQELLRRTDVSTTMVYPHLLNKRGRGVWSVVDGL
jgi:site-specific recombinase XerC